MYAPWKSYLYGLLQNQAHDHQFRQLGLSQGSHAAAFRQTALQSVVGLPSVKNVISPMSESCPQEHPQTDRGNAVQAPLAALSVSRHGAEQGNHIPRDL